MTSDRGEVPGGADAAAKALNRAVGGGKPRSKAKGRTPSGSTDSRDPLPLGEAVGELISNRGWTRDRAGAQVTVLWSQIVGPDLASHVVPESFLDGVLTLQAESTTWATQVRLLLPTLRTTIDAAVGAGVVTDLRIQGPQGPSWKSGSRHVKGRGPRDTYG